MKSAVENVPVEAMIKRHGGTTYVFAVGMRNGNTTATFQIEGLTGNSTARVLGEERTIAVTNGAFEDAFGPWGVHLYEVRGQ